MTPTDTADRLEALVVRMGETQVSLAERVRVLEALVRDLAHGEKLRSGYARAKLDRLGGLVGEVAERLLVTDRVALKLHERVESLESVAFAAEPSPRPTYPTPASRRRRARAPRRSPT